MAGKRKQGGGEDFMDLVAKLPWWAGVALAVVSFIALRMPVQGTSLAPLAHVGLFLIPPLCLAAALVSFLRRNKREALVEQVTRSPAADALNGISWQEF